MEEEIWKEIPGYENLYCVSNKGRVKSLNYNRTGTERILKLQKTSSKRAPKRAQYFNIILYKDGKGKKYLVHRLVAEAFIPNPNNYPCVNHRDETPCNNCVENLEWCTVAYNNSYGTRIKRVTEKNSKKIKCLDLETNKETIYPSIHEASRQMNFIRESIRDSIRKTKSPYKNRYIFTEIEKEID